MSIIFASMVLSPNHDMSLSIFLYNCSLITQASVATGQVWIWHMYNAIRSRVCCINIEKIVLTIKGLEQY